jgi:hypothetical protein
LGTKKEDIFKGLNEEIGIDVIPIHFGGNLKVYDKYPPPYPEF